MKTRLLDILGATLLGGSLVIPIPALAQEKTAAAEGTQTRSIDRREHRQERRIHQGVRSGQLTPKETRKLQREQVHIRRHEAQAKSDGTVTRQERQRLQRELGHASRQIYRQKHDRQARQ